MNIRQRRDGDTVIVTLEGCLDAAHVPNFEAACREWADACPAHILLDGTHLDFIGEAGLRALLVLLKTVQNRSTVALVHPTPLVNHIFGISGFSESIRHYDTIEEARRAF